ncbi:MAG: hypothetical protein A2182_00060 [Candidatus Pacebacteria bacterium RIFOXYA1_FULL_38_18]|nr:MAG: hypothetical protein A2182_00060 [Candidatus Pacebacteria bacterium RIFOXYA1_FULL_38_18]OGJ39457.1 MAG: hypothetical protein A2411_01715 [Candidatus Pacebacteria bacterium RIFOXYC1_FULL_39_21]
MKKIIEYYQRQRKHHDQQKGNFLNFENKNTVNYWRHNRMYSFIKPILINDKKAKWLTVGDGKYGTEAHYIEEFSGTALATDISTKLLKIAKKRKYIKNYQKANAEKLPFTENSFDYVFCKESYHHFPRPIIALYEMIRVSKKAVILIEPNDVIRRGFSWKRVAGIEEIKAKVNKFEVSGNYVYTISRRELEKIALGLGLETIAFSGFDDHYIPGIENELIENNTVKFKKIKMIIYLLDIAFKIGIRDRSLLVSIIFKKKPSKNLKKALKNFGFKIENLPINLYT